MKRKLHTKRHRKALRYVDHKLVDAAIPFVAVTVLGKVVAALTAPKALSGLDQGSYWPVGTPENCYERGLPWNPATRTCEGGGDVPSMTLEEQCAASGGLWWTGAYGAAPRCVPVYEQQAFAAKVAQCQGSGGQWQSILGNIYGDGQCVGGGTTSPANLMTQLIQWGLNNGYLRTHTRQTTRRCSAASVYAASPYCKTIFVETRTGKLYQGVKAAQRMKLYYQAYGGGQSLRQYGQGYNYYGGQIPEVSAIPWE